MGKQNPDQHSCSVLARDEDLHATAPLVHGWTLREHEGPWGAKAVQDAGFISDASHTILFVRHNSRPGTARMWTSAQDFAEPMLFVCTNGKRDTCCAVTGVSLVRELNSDRVLESTHLGGHRFAPTALLMPHGIVLGRLTIEAAKIALSGQIPLANYRGMSSLTRMQQAADIAVRKRESITELRPLAVTEYDDIVHVQHHDGRAWDVRVVTEPTVQRPESCGGQVSQGLAFVAQSVQACSHDGHRSHL